MCGQGGAVGWGAASVMCAQRGLVEWLRELGLRSLIKRHDGRGRPARLPVRDGCPAPTPKPTAGGCDYEEVTLYAYDSWGDGWNGAYFTWTSSDGTSTSATFNSGASATFDLCPGPDGCGDLVVDAGDYPTEITWDIMTPAGELLDSGVADDTGTSCSVTCDPTCYGQSCDDWDAEGYECTDTESWGCDCSGCACGGGGGEYRCRATLRKITKPGGLLSHDRRPP